MDLLESSCKKKENVSFLACAQTQLASDAEETVNRIPLSGLISKIFCKTTVALWICPSRLARKRRMSLS